MNREERQQARTDRYRELADNARKQSEQCFRQSESMASVIPMGQPVHGKADRNYREKIWNKMGQSVKASEKADYYERKAEAAENNNAIYLDDDNAVEKLERKLAELVKAQEDMKAANKVVKNKKLTEEEKKVRLMELGYSETSAVELLTPCYGHIGFPSFSLSNNNANINRIKKRLEMIPDFIDHTRRKGIVVRGWWKTIRKTAFRYFSMISPPRKSGTPSNSTGSAGHVTTVVGSRT